MKVHVSKSYANLLVNIDYYIKDARFIVKTIQNHVKLFQNYVKEKDLKLLLVHLFQVMLKQTFTEGSYDPGKQEEANHCLI